MRAVISLYAVTEFYTYIVKQYYIQRSNKVYVILFLGRNEPSDFLGRVGVVPEMIFTVLFSARQFNRNDSGLGVSESWV